MCNDDASLKAAAVEFFAEIFKEDVTPHIMEQLEVIKLFPTYFDVETTEGVGKAIILEEVESVQNSFAKDKSRGPDGWTIEFYLTFFYLVGLELLAAVEQARCQGFVRSLNATYITLILKCDRPMTFSYYSPI